MTFNESVTVSSDAPYYDPNPSDSGTTRTDLLAGLPTGAVAQTVPRRSHLVNAAAIGASGQQHFAAIYFDAGDVVSSATFISGGTGATTPTNQWASIYSLARAKLAVSDDKTTEAWAANTAKTFTFSTPYTITEAGLYYLGFMVAAAAVPTLMSVGATGASVVYSVAPILQGRDATNTGLTNPASAPATAAALTTSVGFIPYAYVS